ncbi:MAG TPA: AarF/UbiB family protein [Vicinamibacteria bacterium]|nr:AarF/UbiB family protein [Vicinamibacteria bacterium]
MGRLVFLLGLLAPGQELELPTPLEQYQTYDWQADARALAVEIAATAPEEARARAAALLESSSPDEVRDVLHSIDWQRYRGRLERILLHSSRVLEVVPDDAARWKPLIHDALLLFLDGMSEERFVERLVAQAALPRGASRGDRVLAFVADAPSLQKLAQILARNRALAPDLREALQTLENGLRSAQYEEILSVIRREFSKATIEEYRIVFEDRLLAEASVGAVVVARYRPLTSDQGARSACKVLKPRAVSALGEDLALIDRVLAYLEIHADFYDIGDTPLVDIFHEIREALSRETQVADERKNLVRAREYYRDDPAVLVPAVLPFSTENVTCMEFVEGVKVTEAFAGSPRDRAALARRVSDVLTYDVIFSSNDPALFHGDPHAGNVFHAPSAEDPYRLGLIDWGLAAEFSLEERLHLAQLMLGLYLKDEKRLANHSRVLVDGLPEAEDSVRMRDAAAKVVEGNGSDEMFTLLDELLTELASEGYKIRYSAAIFIKSQLTISGILKELDPEFDQDDYVLDRIEGQVWREFGPRLLHTVWFPAWNSHDYRSLLSNEDVKDVQVKRTGRFCKKVGKGIWHGITLQWLF